MITSIKEIYFLLSVRQQRAYLRLQFLVMLMAFSEVIGVLAIGLFLKLVSDMRQLEGPGIVAEIYNWTGLASPVHFLVIAGMAALSVLLISSVISIVTTICLSIFGTKVGAELSSRLYRYYLHREWLFHVETNSSSLTNKIAQECQRVTVGVINPVMQINAKLALASAMAALLFILDPTVAVIGIAFFAALYLLLFFMVREKLSGYGKIITRTQALRFKLMNEGFGGIKDALLLGKQNTLTRYFAEASVELANAQGKASAMGQFPRYAIEFLAFGAVILIVVFLLVSNSDNVETIFPFLSMYALVGLKMLPAFQQVYTSTSTIRNNLAAYESLKEDLRASYQWIDDPPETELTTDQISPLYKIELSKINFAYPRSKQKALDNFSLEIPVNTVVGLVGESGSGKSTAIDVLLGLISPDSGATLIDGKPIEVKNLRAWQNSLGFVAQSIFLADSSIKENVAFGVHPSEIDLDRVETTIELARLGDLVSSLPNGLDTRVGERGVHLSGGQRQRIGIARALYHDASVLVFDEATSSLDSITEQLIVEAIHDFSGSKTIVIIAHRLTTVEAADIIYVIKGGSVIDKGTFQQLSQRNAFFKRFAMNDKS